jgi:hypothetical protein
VNNPTTMLAQVLVLTGELSVEVDDSHSARTVTLVAAGVTRYARVYLASTSAAGTSASVPYDLLTALQTALNAAPASAFWSVTLDPLGAVRITYNGGSGTGKIAWNTATGGTTLRNLLGHTGNSTGNLAVGASKLGDYAPAGTIVATAADESDSAYQVRPVSFAVATTAGGTTYGIDAGSRTARRSVRLRMLPQTISDQGAGEYLTPAFPPDTSGSSSRWTSPSTTYYTGAYADSAHELIAACHRVPGELGVCINGLQQLIAGSTTDFDTGSLEAATARAEEDLFPLSVGGWYKYRDLVLRLTRTGRVSR